MAVPQDHRSSLSALPTGAALLRVPPCLAGDSTSARRPLMTPEVRVSSWSKPCRLPICAILEDVPWLRDQQRSKTEARPAGLQAAGRQMPVLPW